MVDKIVRAWQTLTNQPMAVVMAGVAVLCLLTSLTGRTYQRVVMVVLAVISGVSAWMIATNYRFHW